MAYVTSGTFAHQVMGHWTCALESGPLIGVPPLEIAGGKRASPAGRAVRPELSTETDVFVNISEDM